MLTSALAARIAVILGGASIVGALYLRVESGAARAPANDDSAVVIPEEWEFAYSNSSLPEIRAELDALRLFLEEETRAYYHEQFAAGNYELITEQLPDGSYPLGVNERLAAWQYMPSKGGVAKVTLPRQGFEKAHEANARRAWLLNRESELQALEALQTAQK